MRYIARPCAPASVRRLRCAVDAVVRGLRQRAGREARRATPDRSAARSRRTGLLPRPLRGRAARDHRRGQGARPRRPRRAAGDALRAGLARLLYWGLVDTPLTLVAAPTRRWAARRRGGDPVTRMAQAAVAGRRGISVVAALRTRPFVATPSACPARPGSATSQVESGCQACRRRSAPRRRHHHHRRHRMRIRPRTAHGRGARGGGARPRERLTGSSDANDDYRRSNRCEELRTGPRIYWHYRVNTDYRRQQPPVNASRRRSTH